MIGVVKERRAYGKQMRPSYWISREFDTSAMLLWMAGDLLIILLPQFGSSIVLLLVAGFSAIAFLVSDQNGT